MLDGIIKIVNTYPHQCNSAGIYSDHCCFFEAFWCTKVPALSPKVVHCLPHLQKTMAVKDVMTRPCCLFQAAINT